MYQRRKRFAWMRGCAYWTIGMTVPFYCTAILVLQWDEWFSPLLSRLMPRLLEIVLTPAGLITIAIFMLILLTEPFHGGVSTSAQVGMQLLDPVGCLVVLLLLTILAIVLIALL
ncbi:hypothetical protein ARMA_1801 [Ardenticatena maritima]|uniref:Uncharacterized protein n=1 Tax=Ardenticatena maritima TaxID=872965 RepID=A0A0M9UCW7_9CHLR|nr:hypothetical protein [Ardenticatena maritima]KPL89555.1 hypothetical protein SE16_03820 [Ardenticatena maritima]GAP63378.1 hypothetical protein ARMA_1801 [Ardenticatena maritima]